MSYIRPTFKKPKTIFSTHNALVAQRKDQSPVRSANVARDSKTQPLGPGGPRLKALSFGGCLDLLPGRVMSYDISPTCWILHVELLMMSKSFQAQWPHSGL